MKRKKKGKKEKAIPINKFFAGIKPGIGWVSQNLEREAVEQALEKSYEQTKKDIKKLGKETIRQKVLKLGEKAKKVEKLRKIPIEIISKKLKNPETQKTNYKKSQGGILEKGKQYCQEKFLRRYIMADGVHVYGKEGKWRECKAGVILKQEGDKIYEEGTFCTWERVTSFRKTLEWILMGIFSLDYEMIMISDGAQWIKNTRDKIDCLKNITVIWILDWFHLKEYALKLVRKFGLEEEKAEKIITALWRGNTEEALKEAKLLPISEDEKEKEEQEKALKTFETFIENQKEGIIDYQTYKDNGYLIGSGFMEKRNDTLVKTRMVFQKRMRWGIEGAEAMMQLLTAKMNGRLNEVFA